MAGISLQVYTDAPCPRVEITVDGLDPDTPSRVTVWRTSEGRGSTRRPVRGWSSRLVYGSDLGIDYEAPLARTVTYDLQVVSGAVTPAVTRATCVLDVASGYIQDPLLPGSAVPVLGRWPRSGRGPVLRASAVAALEYRVGLTIDQVLGSPEPIALAGQRLAVAGVDFSVMTRAAEDTTALAELLTTRTLLCVRGLPGWQGLPDVLYTVPQVIEEPVVRASGTGGGLTYWQLVGDSVRPPAIDVVVPLWTYDDVAAIRAGYTYDDIQARAVAAGTTYLSDQSDPTMGGL